jgi:hypothetical protein
LEGKSGNSFVICTRILVLLLIETAPPREGIRDVAELQLNSRDKFRFIPP